VHRLFAYAVIACMLGLVWLLWRSPLRAESRAMLGLVTLQFLTGLSNVVLGWPMPAAILHTGGAAAMTVLIVLAWQRTRFQPFLNVAA
jgi:cytochrome c oxidase assembly protein subunit 15